VARAERVEGSWWPALQRWLADRSGPRRKPPRMGHAQRGYLPICDAPGTYVLVR
jgi:polyhydroxyalkanoate synthase